MALSLQAAWLIASVETRQGEIGRETERDRREKEERKTESEREREGDGENCPEVKKQYI